MKINVEIDVTPEEFRKLMGWPDVRGFQDELIEQLRVQMQAGTEGYDPLSLMKPYLSQAAGTMDSFQKLISGIMQNYAQTQKQNLDQSDEKS